MSWAVIKALDVFGKVVLMNDRSQGDQNKHAKQLTKEFDSFQRQKILLNIKVSERQGVVGQRHCGGECAAAFDVTVSFPSPVPTQLNQLCFLYVFLVVVTVSCESHLVAVIAAFIFVLALALMLLHVFFPADLSVRVWLCNMHEIFLVDGRL